MHNGAVEKRTFRQTELGDGVPVVETLHIWPVLLSRRGLLIGRCQKLHLTIKYFGEDLMDFG